MDLDCGIAYARIAAWLDDELQLPPAGDSWHFSCSPFACRISIEPLEDRELGPLALERTRLVACGDAEALKRFEKLFTLRFVSAGG